MEKLKRELKNKKEKENSLVEEKDKLKQVFHTLWLHFYFPSQLTITIFILGIV